MKPVGIPLYSCRTDHAWPRSHGNDEIDARDGPSDEPDSENQLEILARRLRLDMKALLLFDISDYQVHSRRYHIICLVFNLF